MLIILINGIDGHKVPRSGMFSYIWTRTWGTLYCRLQQHCNCSITKKLIEAHLVLMQLAWSASFWKDLKDYGGFWKPKLAGLALFETVLQKILVPPVSVLLAWLNMMWSLLSVANGIEVALRMSNTSNFSKLSTRLNPRSSGSKQFNRQTWSCCANYDIAVSLQVADRMRELKIRGDDQPWYPIGIYNFTLHGGVRSFANFFSLI